MNDLVIRNGRIIDGTGAPGFVGDLAIDDGKIVSVGGKAGPGRREIDASGLLMTPGWVDIHTHYDGQVAWDPYLSPSSWHGVTTLVMGNCGVGFAPVRRGKEAFLISMMDGVEDIPTETLTAGINFEWESFAEYLDALSRMKRVLDVGTHVPHCAVRAYVMGERGAENQPATARGHRPDGGGRARWGQGRSAGRQHLANPGASDARQGLRSGHLRRDRRDVGDRPRVGRSRATECSRSSLTSPATMQTSNGWRRLSAETGRPISLAALISRRSGMKMRGVLEFIERSNAQGGRMVAQVAARPAASLMSLQSSVHPFSTHRSYRQLMAGLNHDERVARMRDPASASANSQ